MQNKKTIDLTIALLCALIILIAVFGLDNAEMSLWIVFMAGIGFSVFLFLYLSESSKEKALQGDDWQEESITEILLLSEEGKPIASWDIFGKPALVIGKDIKENHVDINLNQSPYASMIDIEHAVLNYCAGNWYIEDLGSKNGLVLQKSADGRKYKLSADQPCKLDKGDVIIIGLTRLKAK